ncbi:MAG: hypothetical protein QOF02_1303 [Blastocatellia bacterium]|nr:hypothetical protein [Blastocatellia bacterium]
MRFQDISPRNITLSLHSSPCSSNSRRAAAIQARAASIPTRAAHVQALAAAIPTRAAAILSRAATIPTLAVSVPTRAVTVLWRAVGVQTLAVSIPERAAGVRSRAAKAVSRAKCVGKLEATVSLREAVAVGLDGGGLANIFASRAGVSYFPAAFMSARACAVAVRRASGPTGVPVAFFIQRSGMTAPVVAMRSNSAPMFPALSICSSI